VAPLLSPNAEQEKSLKSLIERANKISFCRNQSKRGWAALLWPLLVFFKPNSSNGDSARKYENFQDTLIVRRSVKGS